MSARRAKPSIRTPICQSTEDLSHGLSPGFPSNNGAQLALTMLPAANFVQPKPSFCVRPNSRRMGAQKTTIFRGLV
jgi:hypothetical protein